MLLATILICAIWVAFIWWLESRDKAQKRAAQARSEASKKAWRTRKAKAQKVDHASVS